MSETLISSHSVKRLLACYDEECQEQLTPPGAGIDLMSIVTDMLKVSVEIADLYDDSYLKAKNIENLIDVVKKGERDLTLEEMNTIINNVGTRLFLSFVERQIAYDNAKAWDTGTSHALEVREKLNGLLEITDVLTDTPENAQLLGQTDDD